VRPRPRSARRARGPRTLLALLAALALLALGAAPAAQAAPRVVALTPFTANTLAIFGVTPLAIGQTVGGGEHFSRRLAEVERLPLAHPNGPNMEQVAVLDPQLVLSAPVWKKGNDQMRQLGTRVVEIDPRKVSDVPKATRWIGALVGLPRAADELADKQRRHVRAAVSRARSHPRVLLVLGVGRAAFAFLPNSWGGDVVKQAGGRLITQGLSASGGYARISDEYVIARDPDVIIAVPHGNPDEIPRLTRFLRTNPAWSTTKAARSGRVYVSNDNALLQPWTSPAQTIADVQTKFLKNR
jgi:iron complex transport system substrate-binding protein